MSTLRIAALQTVSTPSVERNLATAQRLIAQAAADGAQLVALPEYFCFMGADDRDKLAIAEEPGDGPIQAALADAARRHNVWIIGGTVPLRIPDAERAERWAAPEPAARWRDSSTGRITSALAPPGDRPTYPSDEGSQFALNASCVYAPDGRQAARYDKMHLFRYDNGRECYDEGRVLRAGDTPVAFEADGWRIGLSVCYDLRFPELYRALSFTPGESPCDLLAVPAAFTYTTGRAHWELLLRARAVENQCYVIAAAQGGVHETGRRTWGHSMIVDPWGEVLNVLPEGEGVVMATMDRARIKSVRTQLPALEHRRCP